MELAAVFAATVLIALVGAADDIRTIEVAPRLLLQGDRGRRGDRGHPARRDGHSRFCRGGSSDCSCSSAGIWFLNLVNFMDGIDWMTVAEVLPVSAGLAILGSLGALPAYGIVAALALFGATLGFAPFNRPVARLFLGDVGSLPLGLLIGWLLLLLAARGHLAAALLLPLYYLADATVTLIRRIVRGERVLAGASHAFLSARDRQRTQRSRRRQPACSSSISRSSALAIVTVVAHRTIDPDRGARVRRACWSPLSSAWLSRGEKMTQVLVTGASGFVGRPLTRALAQSGHVVWAAARDPQAVADANERQSDRAARSRQPGPWNSLLAGMDVGDPSCRHRPCRRRYSRRELRPGQSRRDRKPRAGRRRERRQAFHLRVVDPRANRPDRPTSR